MLDGEDINFKRPSQAKEILRRLKKNRGAMIGLFLLICIILVVIFADVIASYEAGVVQIADNKLAPMSSEHPLGCDSYGRDVLSRLVHGARNSLLVAVASSISSCLFGCTLGAIAGYFGGKVDMFLMRFTEIFGAIPFLPFAMILSALMAQMDISENEKIFILMVILGLLSWTGLARLVRGQILLAREQEYVTAAKAMGLRESRIAFRHILPNIVSVIFVTLTLDFATCMLTESTLSYLGFGVTYPRPTWGNMLNGANNSTVIKNFWWRWLFPAIFLAITCICINIVGDTLRDVMDPKSDRDK